MNKIVREHYPVERLPEDLRAGIMPGGHVTVTVVAEPQARADRLLEAMGAADRPRRSKADIDRLAALIRQD
jgi:hypothetical protein